MTDLNILVAPPPAFPSNPVRTEVPVGWGGVLPREDGLSSGSGGKRFENDMAVQRRAEGVGKGGVHVLFGFCAFFIWIQAGLI